MQLEGGGSSVEHKEGWSELSKNKEGNLALGQEAIKCLAYYKVSLDKQSCAVFFSKCNTVFSK